MIVSTVREWDCMVDCMVDCIGTQHANFKGNLQHRLQMHHSSTSRWAWATYMVNKSWFAWRRSDIGKPSLLQLAWIG